MSRPTARCRACGQPIRWALLDTGRWQPVEPDPDPHGQLAVYRDAGGRLRGRHLTPARPGPEHLERRAMPHACPEQNGRD